MTNCPTCGRRVRSIFSHVDHRGPDCLPPLRVRKPRKKAVPITGPGNPNWEAERARCLREGPFFW